jgi:hypothetical protein
MKIRLMLMGLAMSMVAMTGSRAVSQQVPGPHPHYLRALSDLRMARAYLHDNWAWEPVRKDDDHAIREINAAIDEIKKAAIDDGKDLDDHPPIDMHLTPQNRFVKANELLWAAHQDLTKAEDVPQARGLRDRAIGHVDAAHQIVDQAQRTAQWQ